MSDEAIMLITLIFNTDQITFYATRRMTRFLLVGEALMIPRLLDWKYPRWSCTGNTNKKTKKTNTIKGEVTFSAVSTNTFLAKLRTASTLVSVRSSTC